MSISILKIGSPSAVFKPTKVESKNELPECRLLGHLKIDKPIIFFDLETTGLEGNSTRLVEISLVKIHPDRNIETWTSRINPEMPIPEFLKKVHGITDEDVKDCPKFCDIAKELLDFIGDSHLGGYNVINFDFPVLQAEFKRAGLLFGNGNRAIIDPMRIYHRFVSAKPGDKGNRRLVNAYELYCGKKLEKEHTANGDILATIEVLEGQFKMYNDIPQDVYKLSDFCKTKLPGHVDSNGKLVWRKNQDGNWEVVCNYLMPEIRGKALKEVIETDMRTIEKILEPKEFDYPNEVKNIIRNALKGVYPKPPS